MKRDAEVADRLMELYDEDLQALEKKSSEMLPLFSGLKSTSNRYRDEELLAQGGMKAISRVFDAKTNRYVAMARLHSHLSEEFYEPFLREAQLTAMLDHPGCITIYDIGLDDDERPYFTMELKTGQRLDELISEFQRKECEISSDTINSLLQVFLKISDSIAYAHSHSILHLDIKPENIQVGHYGEVTVCDWGLGKVIGDNNYDGGEFDQLLLNQDLLNNMTLAGDIKGTPGYMAPEQIMSDAEKTKATDIYSLGALLYTMLTGQVPASDSNLDEILRKTIEGDLFSPHELFPDKNIPAALSAICMKALECEPAHRYPSVKQLRDDVFSYTTGYITSAETASAFRQLQLFFKRNRSLCYQAFTSLVIILSVTIWFVVTLNQSRIAAESARVKAEDSLAMYKEEKKKILALHEEWSQELKRDSKIFRLHYFWGDNVKSIKETMKRLNKALILNPKHKRLFSWKGHMFFMMQKFSKAKAAFDIYSHREEQLAREVEAMITVPRSDKGLIPLKELASLFTRFNSLKEEGKSEHRHLLEGMMVYDVTKRGYVSGYEDVVEQVVRAWNSGAPDDIFFDYDEVSKSLKVGGESLDQLVIRTSMGDGKCILRFLPIKHLDISDSKMWNLNEITELIHLKSLNIRNTKIYDLERLKDHPALKKLIVTAKQRRKLDFSHVSKSVKVIVK